MESYNLTDKELKIAVMKKFSDHRETHKDNTMLIGIQLMKRRSTLQKDLNSKKEPNK